MEREMVTSLYSYKKKRSTENKVINKKTCATTVESLKHPLKIQGLQEQVLSKQKHSVTSLNLFTSIIFDKRQ